MWCVVVLCQEMQFKWYCPISGKITTLKQALCNELEVLHQDYSCPIWLGSSKGGLGHFSIFLQVYYGFYFC